MKTYFFDQVVVDCTSKFHKIKKEDYLPTGKYKIVDQGKQFVAGYTNDEGLVTKISSPIIIFGDHTKIFKYVDFPLVLGADGTKALKIKNKMADSKYLYYFFKTLKLNDAGYSRHFKFLKETFIPLPEKFDDQIRIASVLSRAEALIIKRKDSIKALDELLKSTFLEMFGDPMRNEKGWEIVSIKDLCSKVIDCPHNTPRYSDEFTGLYCIRSSDIQNGYLDFNATFQVDVNTFNERNTRHIPTYNDILFIREGGRLGNCARVPQDMNICLGQRIMLFTADNNIATSEFLWAAFNTNSLQQCINNLAGGGAAPRVNIKDLINISCFVPPLPLQNQFTEIVKRVEVLKAKYTRSLADLENLYGSLSQQAFKGKLDLSNITVETENEMPSLNELEKVPLPPIIDLKHIQDSKYPLEDFIRSRAGKPFSMDTIINELEEANYYIEIPKYEDIKEQIYELLKESKLIQVLEDVMDDLGKVEKKIMLRANQ